MDLWLSPRCRPVTSAAFEKGTLDLQVDTGATESSLYQRFAAGFPDVVKAYGKPGTKSLGGAGGEMEFPATILPEFKFRLGDFAASLQPAYVLAKDPVWDGTIGMDVLGQAREAAHAFEIATACKRSFADDRSANRTNSP
jgi:hypothetical protein